MDDDYNIAICHLPGCQTLTHRLIRHSAIYHVVLNHFLSMANNGQNYLELHNGIIVSRQSLNSQHGDYIVHRFCHFFSLLAVCLFKVGKFIFLKEIDTEGWVKITIRAPTYILLTGVLHSFVGVQLVYTILPSIPCRLFFFQNNRTQNVPVRILYQTHKR